MENKTSHSKFSKLVLFMVNYQKNKFFIINFNKKYKQYHILNGITIMK